MLRDKIESSQAREQLGVAAQPYAVVTLHRPSNVDQRDKLAELMRALLEVSERMAVVFAIHPRTRKRLEEFGLLSGIAAAPGIRLSEPLGYIDFMSLVCRCAMAITDSGGIQEETTYLGIPCATLRHNTERPITVSEGTNRLLTTRDLPAAAQTVLSGGWTSGRRPEYWDGRSAERAARSLQAFLNTRRPV
jgi:UDP-N-acetylglucosamine 2-epimerase (non-hydrolysing)